MRSRRRNLFVILLVLGFLVVSGVVIVANAYCEKPPAARKEDPVAPDALRLIQGLGANFVTTATLFGIWRYSLQNLQEARKSVMNLQELDGGVFR